jgi:hypothetical protein
MNYHPHLENFVQFHPNLPLFGSFTGTSSGYPKDPWFAERRFGLTTAVPSRILPEAKGLW